MKKTFTIIIVLVLSLLFVGCVRSSELQTEETVAIIEDTSEDETSYSEPPFYKEKYHLNGKNSFSIVAGYGESDNILVNIFCTFDGVNLPEEILAYNEISLNCLSVDAYMVTLEVTSQDYSGISLYMDNQPFWISKPSNYSDDVDTSDVESSVITKYHEIIEDAFASLSKSIENHK